MGESFTKICGCDNDNDPGKDKETNMVSKPKYILDVIYQFSQSKQIKNPKDNAQIKNNVFIKNNFFYNTSKIRQITLKNQAKKIIDAYRKYKNEQSFSKKTNDILTTHDKIQERGDYIGGLDSDGNKYGFGIQKLEDGSLFKGIFSNGKVNGCFRSTKELGIKRRNTKFVIWILVRQQEKVVLFALVEQKIITIVAGYIYRYEGLALICIRNKNMHFF